MGRSESQTTEGRNELEADMPEVVSLMSPRTATQGMPKTEGATLEGGGNGNIFFSF